MATMLTKERNEMRELDKAFPNSKKRCVIGPASSVDQDIASVRQRVRNGQDIPEDIFQRADWMQPCNRFKVARDLATANHPDNKLDWRNNPEDREFYQEKLMASLDNKEIAKEVAAYRQFEMTSDILALPFAMSAFQAVNLSADELIQIITPKARQYFEVRYSGQDGGARSAQWTTTRSAEELKMRLLATDKVEYPLEDLQLGDVNAVSTIDAQLRFDMEMKLDQDALLSLEANKVSSGLKDELNIHSLINQANIPDSNHLNLTNASYGAANTFTIQRLKAILSHINRWSFGGIDPDGPISIQTMIMSPLNAEDSWDYVDLVSGFNLSGAVQDPKDTVTPETRDAIFGSGGLINSAWGHNWTTQFNNRLAKGKLYVMTNQPVGWYFTKTNWDRTIEWKDGPDNIEKNMGEIMHRKAALFVQPTLWRYRYLVVDF